MDAGDSRISILQEKVRILEAKFARLEKAYDGLEEATADRFNSLDKGKHVVQNGVKLIPGDHLVFKSKDNPNVSIIKTEYGGEWCIWFIDSSNPTEMLDESWPYEVLEDHDDRAVKIQKEYIFKMINEGIDKNV